MLQNFIALAVTFSNLALALLKQKKLVKNELSQLFHDCYSRNDGTLPSEKKMLFNYSTLVPAILGEAFCTLRGEKMSLQERKASTFQSAFSVLGDDFFDNNKLPESKFERLFSDIENLRPESSSEELFGLLYLKFRQLKVNELFESYFRKIYSAEKESKIQENQSANIEEIKRVTRNKGAYSLLFFRTSYKNTLSENEQKMLFKLGECVQLANDAFDIYKDYKAGIRTLVTECVDFKEMTVYYLQLINEVKQLAYSIDVPKKNIKRFLQIMSLAVFSRTLACFNKLEANKKLTNNKFDIAAYSREQMVVDMEKPNNILCMLKCFMRLKYAE